MERLDAQLKDFARTAAALVPLPGAGQTPQRLQQLFHWGTRDLSFARIAEAHTDALAILAESGHPPRPAALYGVWASDAPPSHVACSRLGDSGWRIDGIKQFCSGATLVDAALVTAHHEGGILLFDLPLHDGHVTVQPSAWASPAFADTATTAVEFKGLVVSDDCRLRADGWYLSRPGFWHGAAGPAACWAGGAQSLINAAGASKRKDPHTRAHLGALQSIAWGLHAILEQTGREIDADPGDASGSGRTRALKMRHLIERMCTETLDRFARATGPHLLAYDAHVIRQATALNLYIRQCHGERDLEGIPPP